jgi:oligopeptide transport system substrate-binding protein
MLKKIQRDGPWIWGLHPKSFSLHHAWYRNAKPNLMANNTLKYKRLDPVLRALKRKQWNMPVLWPLYLVAGIVVFSLIPAYAGYRRRERMTAR